MNEAIAQWNKAIYVRPIAEMNNYTTIWSVFYEDRDGGAWPLAADHRRAFAHIYLILHGGTAAAIKAKLKPPAHVWSPLAGGNPSIPANEGQNYYPGQGTATSTVATSTTSD